MAALLPLPERFRWESGLLNSDFLPNARYIGHTTYQGKYRYRGVPIDFYLGRDDQGFYYLEMRYWNFFLASWVTISEVNEINQVALREKLDPVIDILIGKNQRLVW